MFKKMKPIKNKKAIDACRSKGFCELCGKKGDHVHHLIHTGYGGAKRLDVPDNLVLLCLSCHNKVHSGEISLKSKYSFEELWEKESEE